MQAAKIGGTALPMALRMSPHFPVKMNSSGKDCARVASRMVRERVEEGCTLRHPEIILKFVEIVEQGSSQRMRL